MSTKIRALLVTALVAMFGFAFAGSALAQGVDVPGADGLGDTEHGPCTEDVLDLPALNFCEDADGTLVGDLPGLKLVGPKKLPDTGAETGDIAALGTAALAGGAVLLRRVRLALAR